MMKYIQKFLRAVVIASALFSLSSCGSKYEDAPFYITTFAISPDAKYLAVPITAEHLGRTRKIIGGAEGIFLYDIEKQEFIAEYRMENDKIFYTLGIDFTKDGQQLIIAYPVETTQKEPDGSPVYDSQIAVMNIDGSDFRPLRKSLFDGILYFPSLSHSGDKIVYLRLADKDTYSGRGLTVRYPEVHEIYLDGANQRQLLPIKIGSSFPPKYMPNDKDVAVISAYQYFKSGDNRTEHYRKENGDNSLYVMGDDAGYEIKPFREFPKQYQSQNDVVAIDNQRMLISLTGKSFRPKLILYDFIAQESQELRDIHDEYRDFDGVALNLSPTSDKGRPSVWRYQFLSRARDTNKVAVLVRHAGTLESHVRIIDLDDGSFKDTGLYNAWMRVASGEVTPKNIWVRE